MKQSRIWKRAKALMLAAALVLSLAACGGSGGASSAGSRSASSEVSASPAEESSASTGGSSVSEESASSEGASSSEGSSSEAAQADSSQEFQSESQTESSSSQSESQVKNPLSGADPGPGAVIAKEATSYVLAAYAAGNTVLGNEYAEIDASNTAEGYICVRYIGGDSSRIKVLIQKSGSSSTYQYDLNTGGEYEVFAFTQGNGDYAVNVYQNVGGQSYALLYGTTISVSLRGSTLPFLYPNQYVNFWSGSTTVATGAELAKTAENDLGIVSNVYNYVLENMQYDYNKANEVATGGITTYLPKVDSILASGYGICFDYAAVMTTMLRTQRIPTKLVVGYSGGIYHAWINTYITDVGWVNGVIQFDGQSWKLMDPTFADNDNQSASIMSYIANTGNYTPMFYY